MVKCAEMALCAVAPRYTFPRDFVSSELLACWRVNLLEPMPKELLDLMAGKFRLLGDSARLAILRAVEEEERTVGQVVTETGLGQANVSKHLKMLADAGMLSRRKQGVQVFYRLTDPVVLKICRLVCDTILRKLQSQLRDQRRMLERSRRQS